VGEKQEKKAAVIGKMLVPLGWYGYLFNPPRSPLKEKYTQ